VITHIGNTPVLDVNDARTEVRRYTPGEALDLTVVRDGTTAQLRTVLVSDNSVP
jgi:S1-C subfamily serine protease